MRAFASEGAEVALLHLGDADNAARLVAGLDQQGRSALALECDVADPAAVTEAMGQVEAGLGRVDILVNCAGVVDQTPFAQITLEHWDRMIAVHLRGVFLCTRFVLPRMLERGMGKIINVASQLGQIGGTEMVHYSASKAGVIGFTKALAREVSTKGIHVNAIAPGPILTEMMAQETEEWASQKLSELPIGRFGEVHEVAPTAVFLASDDSSYYVGQTLCPNGGDVML